MILTKPDGTTCIMAAGTHFFTVDPRDQTIRVKRGTPRFGIKLQGEENGVERLRSFRSRIPQEDDIIITVENDKPS